MADVVSICNLALSYLGDSANMVGNQCAGKKHSGRALLKAIPNSSERSS